MDDELNKNENEQIPQAEEPADTGREVEELRAQIDALKAETEKLTRELVNKVTDKTPRPSGDAGAYYREMMKP